MQRELLLLREMRDDGAMLVAGNVGVGLEPSLEEGTRVFRIEADGLDLLDDAGDDDLQQALPAGWLVVGGQLARD